MKIKSGIWIFVLGYLVEFIGAWAKLTHQSFADATLAIATLLKVIGLLVFIFGFLAHPRVKEFLKSENPAT